ncbi:glycogen-binding domain-containing protein [Nitratiruptor tergarcus]|uniref:Glycogen recognition site of AMP-activated protein kinase n=1 Tax=Nitratiruptor tergarcus DSM 16512 TaxID=1069081 RepID=A0A1W1WTM7_9BACT|nr:glycogen-binding domain-containing protein [Nitratiruptor tergarcus]SMC09674.1 Glycogen recognition site of AMP-activated protein kinase [Nitratiruptor tergarcus DSM 16512]
MIKIHPKSITFILQTEANEVKIKGSWNDWKAEPMMRKDGVFTKTKRLKPGTYEFGYEVDGRWLADETLPTTPSPYGSLNSVLKVEP